MIAHSQGRRGGMLTTQKDQSLPDKWRERPEKKGQFRWFGGLAGLMKGCGLHPVGLKYDGAADHREESPSHPVLPSCSSVPLKGRRGVSQNLCLLEMEKNWQKKQNSIYANCGGNLSFACFTRGRKAREKESACTISRLSTPALPFLPATEPRGQKSPFPFAIWPREKGQKGGPSCLKLFLQPPHTPISPAE